MRLIRLVDRYIATEIFLYYFAIYFTMVFLLTINDMFLMLGQYTRYKVPWEIVFQMTYLRSFFFMPVSVPAAVLFSVLLGVGRMAYDNEINALRTSGISIRRLMRMPLIIGLASSLLVWHLDHYIVSPNLEKWADLYIRYLSTASLGMENIRPERFLMGPDNQYFYFGSVDTRNQTFSNAFGYKTQFGSQISEMYVAQTGHYKGETLYLQNGRIYKFDYKGEITEIAQFDEMEIDVKTLIGEKLQFALPVNLMSFQQLQRHIESARREGVSNLSLPELMTEYYFKFSFPLTALLFGLITFVLATRATRGGRYTSIVYAIFLFAVYYSLVSGSRILGYNNILPPVLAGWLVTIVFGILAIIMLIRGEW